MLSCRRTRHRDFVEVEAAAKVRPSSGDVPWDKRQDGTYEKAGVEPSVRPAEESGRTDQAPDDRGAVEDGRTAACPLASRVNLCSIEIGSLAVDDRLRASARHDSERTVMKA